MTRHEYVERYLQSKEDNELYHHGILGMKWGVRRYQNEDGSLTPAGRSRYGVEKLEKQAINKNYKESRKNGGSFVFKSYRQSTGANYDKAVEDFGKRVLNDDKYKELSKKARDAEYKRLMAEKPYASDEAKYDEYMSSKQYKELTDASENAARAKEKYVQEKADAYIDTIKNAKVKDMKIKDSDADFVKQYVSGKFDDYVWDENLEYNPDHYYTEGFEKRWK